MPRKLLILGAGGHGKVVADVAACMNVFAEIRFADDAAPQKPLAYPYAGSIEESLKYLPEYEVFVAIGSSRIRQKIMNRLCEYGARFPVLIHPHSSVCSDAAIGEGSVVMPGAVINAGSRIGKGVIVNTCASVDHDCSLGEFCHVAVGAHVCGSVTVGAHTWIGAGATLINNISVTGGCMIGAGAVVVKNIEKSGIYKGVPAVMDTPAKFFGGGVATYWNHKVKYMECAA